MRHPRGYVAAGVAASVWLAAAAAAVAAECRDELIASQSSLQTTSAGIEQAAAAPPAEKCPAQRRHYAAMMKFRDVLSRCDLSKDRAGRVAGLDASIDRFRKAMPPGCRP